MPEEGAETERTRRSFGSEAFVFFGFAILTFVMTWPWITHPRDAVIDKGDSYLNSWILWWDYHQTFHDPTNLFHGNIFFPYKYTLAFSEHNYGISLLFFPLFALGARPLTVHGLAILLGFAFAGYGAFRLTRTLTGSAGAAWVAGIAFAFVPYRIHLLTHVNYLFSAWIPLTLEALVLFLRKPTRRRAAWLGAAFLMNGLTCVHWLLLTIIPLAVTGVLLIVRLRRERDRDVFLRGGIALGAAVVALLPFLVPYQRAARLYGFVRTAEDAREYSAHLIHWLTVDAHIKVWKNLGDPAQPWERCLFPGLLLLLLPLAGLLLTAPSETSPDRALAGDHPPRPPPAWALIALDMIAVAAGTVALLASGEVPFRIVVRGHDLLTASDPARAIALLTCALLSRWWLAYPKAFPLLRERSLRLSLRRGRRPEVIGVALIWTLLGFFGSLGMNFPFHRVLFELVPIFRSIRGPARWAMVCDVGLAVLAGVGVLRLAERVSKRPGRSRHAAAAVFALFGLAILVEVHATPLDVVHGEPDPDELTLRLRATPMTGGLVQLPIGGSRGNYLYMLRAADHGKPLVNAVSGFQTPIVANLEELTRERPIPDALLDLLETIPASYLTVRESWLERDERKALHSLLAMGLETGRLRFVRRFGETTSDDLYAVTKTEPAARPEEPLPWDIAETLPLATTGGREDDSLVGSIDAPAEGNDVRGDLTVHGWARIVGEDLGVSVLIDGDARRPASFTRSPRPDVAAALPTLGDCSKAGYAAVFRFVRGDEGPHEIRVLFRTVDGRVRRYPIRKFVWKP